ncbi:MAG: hypothetical protein RL477_1642 [Pseudomonadota bacterium]|jgi:putative oxidoreductase
MHTGHGAVVILGHILIAVFFLYIGLRNLRIIPRHVERFRNYGIPFPGPFLAAGFAFQFGGGLLVLAGWHADLGAILLIVFTVLANLLYHHFWTMKDPATRRIHQNYFFNNLAVMGGLLLVFAAAP